MTTPTDKFIEEKWREDILEVVQGYKAGVNSVGDVLREVDHLLQAQRAEMVKRLPEERGELKRTEQELTEDEKTFDEGFNICLTEVKEALNNK